MLFSVCIPVYNTSKYLDECLHSVLNQTENDYEILLVDDGSTDGSSRMCDEYAGKYPNIQVIHKENEGLLMTRRRGFQEAKGDYFVCLDSDDALCDMDALKKIRRMIEEKSADLVIYEYICAAELNSEQPDRYISLFDHPDGHMFQGESKRELYRKLLLGKSLNPIFIKAFSRELVDLDVDYSQWKDSLVNGQAEDLLQTLPILDAAKRVAYLKEPLYFYRWNPASISRNVRPDYYYAYRTVYLRANAYLGKWGFDESQIHRFMQAQINMIFSVLLAERHPDHRKWMEVLQNVAEDWFFADLWKKRDGKYVCRYYLLMGELILKKRFALLQVTKKSVECISHMKKRFLRRK